MPKLEIWANMPVKDVEVTRRFFKDLGFKPNGGHESRDLASFVFSEDHFVIHFFHKDVFEKNSDVSASDASAGAEIIFTIGAATREEVDQWRDKVIKAGGTILTGPKEIPEGYNLVFSDPDGHRFNVFYWNR